MPEISPQTQQLLKEYTGGIPRDSKIISDNSATGIISVLEYTSGKLAVKKAKEPDLPTRDENRILVRREAKNLDAISTTKYAKNVPYVADVKDDEKGVSIVMEYLDGYKNLDEQINSYPPLEQLQILSQAKQILDGIQADAHITHLDFSFGNIMVKGLGKNLKLKIIDWAQAVPNGNNKQLIQSEQYFLSSMNKIIRGEPILSEKIRTLTTDLETMTPESAKKAVNSFLDQARQRYATYATHEQSRKFNLDVIDSISIYNKLTPKDTVQKILESIEQKTGEYTTIPVFYEKEPIPGWT